MEAALAARDVVGVEDFVLLENYSDISAFVDNLRKRFRESLIYVSSSARLTLETDNTIGDRRVCLSHGCNASKLTIIGRVVFTVE